MKQNTKDNAVSPVIGVMLMLVVTIVIAALVSSFAGGLSSSTEASPMITFTVDASKENGLLITCTGISSGFLDTNDVSVLVSRLNSDDYYEVPVSAFNISSSTLTAGTFLEISRNGLKDVVVKLGDSATKPSYLTAAEVYNIIGSKITVKIANANGVIGTASAHVKA